MFVEGCVAVESGSLYGGKDAAGMGMWLCHAGGNTNKAQIWMCESAQDCEESKADAPYAVKRPTVPGTVKRGLGSQPPAFLARPHLPLAPQFSTTAAARPVGTEK